MQVFDDSVTNYSYVLRHFEMIIESGFYLFFMILYYIDIDNKDIGINI